MNPEESTRAAIFAVAASIERCPQAVDCRNRAIRVIAAAAPPDSDRATAQHEACRLCAEAAVWAMERDPALAELVTTRDLALYIFRGCCAVVLGGLWEVSLDLRDPHAN